MKEQDFDEEEDSDAKLANKINFEKTIFLQIQIATKELSYGTTNAWNAVNTLGDLLTAYHTEEYREQMNKLEKTLNHRFKQIDDTHNTSTIANVNKRKEIERLNTAGDKFRAIMRLLGQLGILFLKKEKMMM